ncbi:MAG: hypothetical protein L0Y80_11255 [Ignavibacteriae bacterium]|nr:hypothetical protein [Ignavibacteriota bacterium]
MKSVWPYGALSALLVCASTAVAQEAIRPPRVETQDSLRYTTLGFERVLNTFLWNGGLTYAGTLGGLRFNTQQGVRSRLIRAEQQSIQDEYLARVFAEGDVGDRWKMQAHLYSNALADNRLLDLGKLAQHQGLAGLEYQWGDGISTGALGGYEYNAQGNERDAGFAYLLRAKATNVQLESFQADIHGRLSQSFLNPRQLRDDSLTVNIGRQFGPDALNILAVKFNNQRREFYTAAETGIQQRYNVRNNIFRRSAQTLEIADSIQYRSSERLQFLLSGGVFNRAIDRGFRYKDFSLNSGAVLDTRVNEFQLFGSLEMHFRLHQDVGGMFQIAFREREETHEVVEEAGASLALIQDQERAAKRLGNISRQTVVRSRNALYLSEKDTLNFVGSASILRYDTPDTLNIDDRDELLLAFGIETRHALSRHVHVTLSADAALNHLVYLHRLQSANNNWNRVIRFSPRVEYTPASWFRSVNYAEVLANYTVYDFEDQVALVRSFSFRQASWSDSTALQLTPRLGVEFLGSVRVYERGILRWSEFKERPQNYFLERSYWPQLTLRFGERLQAAVGYRYFAQDRYKYEAGVRAFERRLETFGPTVSLLWYADGLHQLMLQGWRETQQEEGKTIRTIPNVFMKIGFAL